MATRKRNELEYEMWETLPDRGRRYWKDVADRKGGWARYIKVVDANEVTLSFVQQIYNREGLLAAIHEKFPVDKGHRWL